MRKKYLIIVMIFMLFVFVGCNKKDEIVKEGELLTVSDVNLKYDTTATVKELNFKYDNRFKLSLSDDSVTIQLEVENGPVFYIDITSTYISSFDEAVEYYEPLYNSYSTLTIGGKTWARFEDIIDDSEANQIVYVVEHNNTVYLVRFLKSEGIEEVEKEFLMNITFSAKVDTNE